jgi:transcriptional regulator CtsR
MLVGPSRGAWHIFSMQETHRQGHFADSPRGRGGQSRLKRTKSRNIHDSLHKLLSLLHTPNLIFHASKNSTEDYVDTRNQESPILLGSGRKAMVDLKQKFSRNSMFGQLSCLASRWIPKIWENHLNSYLMKYFTKL